LPGSPRSHVQRRRYCGRGAEGIYERKRGHRKKLKAAAQLLALGQLDISKPAKADEDIDPDEDGNPVDELAAAFAAFGLVPEAGEVEAVLEKELFYLWPENLPVFNFWLTIQSQWFWSEGQRTGLNHAGVEVNLKYAGLKRKQRAEYFQMIRVMEMACLNAWREQRDLAL
jgi:hypothetical protein